MTRIFVGGTSGDTTNWFVDSNWLDSTSGSPLSANGVPTSADDVYIGIVSASYDCSAISATNVKSITTTSGFSNNIFFGSLLTVQDGNCSFDHTGNLTLNGITVNGNSATLHIGSGVGTVTATSCVVTMNTATAGVIDFDKLFSIKQIVFIDNSVVNNTGSQNVRASNSDVPLIIGNTVTLTGGNYDCRRTTNGDFHSIGTGCTFSCQFIFRPASAGITCQLPVISTSNVLSIYTGANNCTSELTGNIASTNNNIELYDGGFSGSVIDLNGYNVGCGNIFYSANTQADAVINYGSGTHTIKTFNATDFNNGTDNLETATLNVTGSFAFGSNHTINPGTSVINLTGTTACTFTTAGKSVYDLNINKTATAGVTFTGNIDSHDFKVLATNTQAVTWAGYTLTSDGNVTLDGTGTLDLGNGITCNGASSNFHIESTVGTVTRTNCILTMNTSTAGVIDDDKSNTTYWKKVILNGKVLTSGVKMIIRSPINESPITITDNSELTNSGSIYFSTGGGDFSIDIGNNVVLKGNSSYDFIFYNGTVTLPAINHTGGGIFSLQSYGATVIELAGDLFISGYYTGFMKQSTSKYTINTNNHSITILQALEIINSISTNILEFNCGSSIISIGNFNHEINTHYAETFNLDSSIWNVNGNSAVWNVNGNFRLWPNETVNPGTSTVNILNTSNITLAGKSLHTVNLNAPTKTITSIDNLTTTGALTISSGTTYNTGATTTTVGTNLTDLQGTTFNKLVMASTATKTITVGATKTLTLTTLTDTDINGSAGALTQWRSSSDGSQYNITIPAPITLQYQNPKDCVSNFEITVSDGTSIDGFNNINWLFASGGSDYYFTAVIDGELVSVFRMEQNGCNVYIVYIDSLGNLRVKYKYMENPVGDTVTIV